jgi:TatD DNase family protein
VKLGAFDSHAHLDLAEFESDREEVISRALSSGVARINTVGIDIAASRKAIALAERYPPVVASVGIHPQEAHKVGTSDFQELEHLCRQGRVVAIGETGLDYYHGDAPREAQREVFKKELSLAAAAGLPVIIHSRQAEQEVKAILEEWAMRQLSSSALGVIHCFSGSLEAASFYLNLGFLLSVGAYIGYPSSAAFRETLKQLPLGKILVETDCPFLPPQKMRGKRNEPAYVIATLEVLAGLKSVSLEEAAQQTAANARGLFRLSE